MKRDYRAINKNLCGLLCNLFKQDNNIILCENANYLAFLVLAELVPLLLMLDFLDNPLLGVPELDVIAE